MSVVIICTDQRKKIFGKIDLEYIPFKMPMHADGENCGQRVLEPLYANIFMVWIPWFNPEKPGMVWRLLLKKQGWLEKYLHFRVKQAMHEQVSYLYKNNLSGDHMTQDLINRQTEVIYAKGIKEYFADIHLDQDTNLLLKKQALFKEKIPDIVERLSRKRPRPNTAVIISGPHYEDTIRFTMLMSSSLKNVSVLNLEQNSESEALSKWCTHYNENEGTVITTLSDIRLLKRGDVILDLCGGNETELMIRKTREDAIIINAGKKYDRHIRRKIISSETCIPKVPQHFFNAIGTEGVAQIDMETLMYATLDHCDTSGNHTIYTNIDIEISVL